MDIDIKPQEDFLYKIIGEQYIKMAILQENFIKISKELDGLKKLNKKNENNEVTA